MWIFRVTKPVADNRRSTRDCERRRVKSRNIPSEFLNPVKGDLWFDYPSGSCAHMIRHNYEELFADDPLWLPRAKALAARTYEFTEYLVDVLGITDFRRTLGWPADLSSDLSSDRGLGIDRQPRELLANIKGAEIRELPEAEDCCGFGGIFSVEHPELSAEMLKRKIKNLEATQSPTLVVCDAGCLMHIQGGLHRNKMKQKVVHIAEILNQSLRRFQCITVLR